MRVYFGDLLVIQFVLRLSGFNFVSYDVFTIEPYYTIRETLFYIGW